MRRRQTVGLLFALLVSLNASSIKAGPVQTTLDGDSPVVRKSNRELRDATLVRSEPEYPALARAARVSGTVEVELALDQEGNVKRARATSGHPLLKDAAVAAARQWKFDPAKISAATATIVGTLAFVFDLAVSTRAAKEPYINEWESSWEANLKICLEEIERQPADNTRLTMTLADLAVSVFDEKSVHETVRVFEDLERRDKMPAAAKAYYGKMLVEKYDYDLRQATERGEDRSTVEVNLSRALPLFIAAYYEDLANNFHDAARLIDLGRFITNVYRRLGNAEEGINWSKNMLSERRLPDTARAQVSYELGVQYWKKAYDLLLAYNRKTQAIPEADLAAIRDCVTEGYSHIQTTHSLDPDFANAWFYERQLAIIEGSLEVDTEKQKLILEKINKTQERYLSLVRERRGEANSSDSSTDKAAGLTYSSGLPSLNIAPTPPPPPPPPPPPHSSPGAKPPSD